MKVRFLAIVRHLTLGLLVAAPAVLAQPALKIQPLAEKKVSALPAAPLVWRIETFPDLAQAQAAAGTYSLAVEAAGKAWLFRLGTAGVDAPAGGTKIAEVGPLPNLVATEYLLRINQASGPPGSMTSIHSHPGSEAFYVVSGEQSIRTPRGVLRVLPGRAEAGQGADVPMQVSSSGSTDLLALVMFVVDAGRPFSSPAKLADQ